MRADMELGALHERASAVLARLTEGGAGAVVADAAEEKSNKRDQRINYMNSLLLYFH